MTPERRPTNRKFRLIMGALAVVAVVSGGAAYAASQDDSPQARSQAIVDDAAGTLGVDPSKLSDALKKALENQVDAQVTAGKLTKEQGDAIKQRIEDGTQPIFGGPGFGGPRGHFGGPGFGGPGGPGFGFGVRLRRPGPDGGHRGRRDLPRPQAGRPGDAAAIRQVAGGHRDRPRARRSRGSRRRSPTAATKQLDAAVTAGKLTKDQETKLLAGPRLPPRRPRQRRPQGRRGFRRGGPAAVRAQRLRLRPRAPGLMARHRGRRDLSRPQARRPGHAAALRQVARRHREGPGQDRRRAQDGDHRRGDEAARRGRDGRQAHEGAGDEGARRPLLAPRRPRQRRRTRPLRLRHGHGRQGRRPDGSWRPDDGPPPPPAPADRPRRRPRRLGRSSSSAHPGRRRCAFRGVRARLSGRLARAEQSRAQRRRSGSG